jgi:hypothetical protein
MVPGVPAGSGREAPHASAFSTDADDDPPSGVIFRCEVLASTPRLAVSTTELKDMPLDHRAGFIVSFVDGTYTVEMILDACAMKREDAMAILSALAARGIISMG